MARRECCGCGATLTLVFCVLLLARSCDGARHASGVDGLAKNGANATESTRVGLGHPSANVGWTVNPFVVVGGPGQKSVFFWAPGQGALLSGLDVWTGADAVNGIAVTFTAGKFTSGSTGLIGAKEGHHSTLALAPGERITAMSLWDNGRPVPGWAFGAMKIVTDGGQTFEAGLGHGERGAENVIDVGSGLVVGISGRFGASVSAFGACFLKPVVSATLDVQSYPTLRELSPAGGKDRAVLAYVTYTNFGDEAQHVRMTGAPTVAAHHQWKSKDAGILGVDVGIHAGVPRVVDADGVPSNWTVSDPIDWGSEGQEEDVRRVYDLPLTVNPHSSVDAKATLAQIDLDIEFTGKVHTVVEGGAVWSYATKGEYSGVAYAVTVTLGNETRLDGGGADLGPERGVDDAEVWAWKGVGLASET